MFRSQCEGLYQEKTEISAWSDGLARSLFERRITLRDFWDRHTRSPSIYQESAHCCSEIRKWHIWTPDTHAKSEKWCAEQFSCVDRQGPMVPKQSWFKSDWLQLRISKIFTVYVQSELYESEERINVSYKNGLDIFVISGLRVEGNWSCFCIKDTIHLKVNEASFEVHLQHMAHRFQLSIFNTQLYCSVLKMMKLRFRWSPLRFLKNEFELTVDILFVGSRRRRCRPMYLRFSRSGLWTVASAFQQH